MTMTDLRGKFDTADAALQFILAGNARFTLKSEKTGTRYTYKASQPKDGPVPEPDVRFIGLLTGPDNARDYQYIGYLRLAHKMIDVSAEKLGTRDLWELYAGNKGNAQHPAFIALYWAMERLCRGTIPAQLEIWHEARCGRCGRALTVPESIESGFGPECINKVMSHG